MKYRFITASIAITLLTTSCVSKKKFTELQGNYDDTRVQLTKTQVEKEAIEAKYAAIENRVDEYNSKINALKDINGTLVAENDTKYDLTQGGVIMSKATKEKMNAALANANPAELANARTLEDSMNIVVSQNLKRNLDESMANDDIDINIEESVVMITISDKLLFNSGSYRVSSKAKDLLQRLADVVNSEPSIEVLVEGHTDNRTVKQGAYIKDNWELSVERSTAIVRELQDKYNVDPAKLIAAGRSSYHPIVENVDSDSRAINRRTRIVILPNLDKFLSMLSVN
ncbi:cell envelope biogenesis protein OmpA [Dokdonia sinensis]|uniref:Cell envelope biogenesis protein OmpA n=1 Tax=Dokdonia sinensis TaxID=2479847 RepID=A0A3M0GQ83_9FLAO|nr:OmpA family protein [Dokdonia sinensis]RMB59426.1 cell envelope biogenesis protein OmpA [Dokdonia sinensis]